MHPPTVPEAQHEARHDAPPVAGQNAQPARGGGWLGALRRVRTFDALRSHDFRLLWIGQGCISLGTWMDQVTRGWLLYQLTDSPLQLGLVRGAQALPLLVLSPVAGTAADRYDRKAQMLVAQVLDGLMYAILATLIFSGQIQPWHVYVTAILGGIVQTFQNPARQAMVADSVPPQYLTNAIGLNTIFFNLARTLGPAIAGLLIVAAGTGGSYTAQAALYGVASILTITLPAALRYPSGAAARHARSLSFRQSTVEGWQFSWTNQTVRAGMLISGIASLFVIPFTILLPVFARDILHTGATGQGVLLSAMGVGSLVSAILVASLGDQLPRGLLMLGGVTLYGLAVVAFAASSWFALSVGLMVLIGLLHVSSHALVHTVIQAYTPAELRGRVMGLFQQSFVVLQIGSLSLGSLAAILGAPPAMAAMGAAGSLATIILSIAVPTARRIR